MVNSWSSARALHHHPVVSPGYSSSYARDHPFLRNLLLVSPYQQTISNHIKSFLSRERQISPSPRIVITALLGRDLPASTATVIRHLAISHLGAGEVSCDVFVEAGFVGWRIPTISIKNMSFSHRRKRKGWKDMYLIGFFGRRLAWPRASSGPVGLGRRCLLGLTC